MTTPTWHTIPTRRVTLADLPRDGARVVVRDGHQVERVGRWDENAREWWGTMRVDGHVVDWRWSMACAEEWRERDGNEHND